jgi:hypothetical protein
VVAQAPLKAILPTYQHDPFGLRIALRDAGMEDVLL